MRTFKILHRKRRQDTGSNKWRHKIQKCTIEINSAIVLRRYFVGEQGGNYK